MADVDADAVGDGSVLEAVADLTRTLTPEHRAAVAALLQSLVRANQGASGDTLRRQIADAATLLGAPIGAAASDGLFRAPDTSEDTSIDLRTTTQPSEPQTENPDKIEWYSKAWGAAKHEGITDLIESIYRDPDEAYPDPNSASRERRCRDGYVVVVAKDGTILAFFTPDAPPPD